MSDLLERQFAFNRLIPLLLDKAIALGFDVKLGEVYRPPETAKIYAEQGRGISNSLHCEGLALDLVLFRDGERCIKSEDYAELGCYWKMLHSLARWGGDFIGRKDGGHFSMSYNGRA